MAFDQNILQNENTVIKWDRINRTSVMDNQ